MGCTLQVKNQSVDLGYHAGQNSGVAQVFRLHGGLIL